MRLIEKEMTDRFYDILEKHGDKTWADFRFQWNYEFVKPTAKKEF